MTRPAPGIRLRHVGRWLDPPCYSAEVAVPSSARRLAAKSPKCAFANQALRALDPGTPVTYAGPVRGFMGMDAVKGVAVAITLTVVLAIPGTALGSAFFKGPVNGGANNAGVEFRAKFRHDEPRKVLEFRWFNVPVPPNCADSFEGLKFEMKVND